MGQDPRIQGGKGAEGLHNHLHFWAAVGLLGNRGKQGRQSLPSGSQVGEDPAGEGYTSRPFRTLGTKEGCPEEVVGELRMSEKGGGQQEGYTLRN